VKAPELSQHGGVFPAGFHLVMSAPAGDVLYSLDGSDPRLPGGSPAPGAILYQTPVTLEQSTRVLARALDGGAWSALTDATFISETPPALRITEVMYHGAPGNEAGTFSPSAFEFVEVQNVGAQPLALAGMRLRGGVEFDFSAGSMPSLEPGGFALVVENVNALEARYGPGLPIAGEYSGDLSNGGEEIRLEGSFGETILDFAYDDAWAPSTDGEGRSLVIRDASAPPSAWGEEASWRESARLGGSPGRDDDSQAAAFQIPSDTNQDGRLDLSDAVSLLGHLFLGAPAVLACGDGSLADPGNHALLNANGDPKVDLADVIYVLAYLYLGGARRFSEANAGRWQAVPPPAHHEPTTPPSRPSSAPVPQPRRVRASHAMQESTFMNDLTVRTARTALAAAALCLGLSARVVADTNVAPLGIATQSTTDFGGFPERANDGNTDGDFGAGSTSHTMGGDPAPFWQVDLDKEYPISRIVVWNRTDCCGQRLTNFHISILDSSASEVEGDDFFTDLSFPDPSFEWTIDPPVNGLTVRIDRLGADTAASYFFRWRRCRFSQMRRGLRDHHAQAAQRDRFRGR
jgi:hypothetical protein